MSLSALKNVGANLDRLLDTDEAVSLSAYARNLEAEYDQLDIPVPGWLTKSSDILREEIARRTRAADLAELKRLEGELEGYKPINEKRTDAQKNLANLQKKLGLSATSAGR